MSPKYTLLTFGAGLPNWRAAAQRLGGQARETGWFDKVVVHSERSLTSDFPNFVAQHRQILNSRVRGFGYWIWKPFLVWRALLSARQAGSDGVIYLDAGFELNPRSSIATRRLGEYWELARDGGGVFAMHLPGHPEVAWTRTSVLDHFGLGLAERLAPQVQATPILTPTDFAIDFAELWYQHCIADQYELVRDATSNEPNDPSFRAHRHDQSVFSGLLKTHSVATLPDETYWAPEWSTSGADYPLWAARNRTRVSILDQRLASRGIQLSEKVYSRLYLKLFGE